MGKDKILAFFFASSKRFTNFASSHEDDENLRDEKTNNKNNIIMKKCIISVFIAFAAIVAAHAQQIAVVSSDGATTMYQTFADAVEGATNESTVYLPGGGFETSGVTVNKKLFIIGIGHKGTGESADGNTIISGDLYFGTGSNGSTLMGCYVSGNVWIGYNNAEGDNACTVHNITVQYCNVGSIQVSSSSCTGTIVTQDYIRGGSNFRGASAIFRNNIAHSIDNLDGSIIAYNIITSNLNSGWGPYVSLLNCDNCTFANNIVLNDGGNSSGDLIYGSSCIVQNNMSNQGSGEDAIAIGGVSWDQVFVNFNGGNISTASDFHFQEEYKDYEHQVGIYAGSGFKDSGLAPVPTIVAKEISEQTNAEGKLNIKIRVKASE